MSILPILLAPLLSFQSAGEGVVAIKNDAPETWVVEYPQTISPLVQDYRRCLNAADRRVRGQADFEVQHRADVTRCEAVSAAAQADARRIVANRAASEEFTPDDVAPTFDHIGRVHIARGADLDKQFLLRIQNAERASDEYDRTRPKGLVIELLDASVVKDRAAAEGRKGGGE